MMLRTIKNSNPVGITNKGGLFLLETKETLYEFDLVLVHAFYVGLLKPAGYMVYNIIEPNVYKMRPIDDNVHIVNDIPIETSFNVISGPNSPYSKVETAPYTFENPKIQEQMDKDLNALKKVKNLSNG